MATAGVAAVQYARMPGEKRLLPTSKVGTDFLASSHFTIAQDETQAGHTHKSIFKKDYIPWLVDSKPAASKPPNPAELLQKDDRYFNEKTSETRQAYEYRSTDKPQLIGDPSKLSATNFKMDSDKAFDSFQTTHKLHYTPKEGDYLGRNKGKDNPMQSFIPQGDPDKALDPVSDYKDRYRGHDVSAIRTDKRNPVKGGPGTIQGDSRQLNFITTHDDTFKGWSLPKISSYPAPVGSNIPQGDKDKETSMITTQQASFPAHDPNCLRPYNRADVTGKLRQTNFRQNDGHGAWNTYLSTMSDSYRPMHDKVERSGPLGHRNNSDFPTGDADPYRNAERSNLTTNRFYQGRPPPTQRPTIVSGADRRTRSQVCFGEPRLAGDFYETTTDSTFRPVSVPHNPVKLDNNTRSHIPVNYYSNEDNPTMYRTDFENPKQDRMALNPDGISALKESHIRPPLGGARQFNTEHLDQYTPKRTAVDSVKDPGRLQRSSVPLGTLSY